LILTAGNYSEGTPIFYLILGLTLLLALFFYARRYKRFREYLFRSIFHPYNFYADIRDQRIIALGQTFFLAILNSLAFGMIVSAILYFVRTNDIAQQLLVICSPIRSIVPGIFKLIWQPEYFTLVIAAICMLGIFAISGIIRLMALFVKSKFFYTDAIAIVVWASTPLLVFLPLSMVLIRLVDMFQPFMLISVIIVAAFLIWYLLRIIKATIVVFDVKTRIAYSIATGLLAIFVLINWWYLNTYNALSKYMEYLYNYVMNI
ncbi:MAG: YIP1 family protein, partial [Candidatus Kapabacteria bacterium]|nr:YIP1 family protein [Candidatus Kapabacteria bacterium]